MLKAVLATVVPLVASAAFFGRDLAALVDRRAPPEPAAQARSATPPAAGCRRGEEMTLHADRSGHFVATFELDGRHVPMMIDTGATRVILPHEEAQRLGLALTGARQVPVSTANGMIQASLATVNRLKLGPICLDRVDVLVMPAGRLPVGLVGMSVIGQLARFEVSRTRLVMTH